MMMMIMMLVDAQHHDITACVGMHLIGIILASLVGAPREYNEYHDLALSSSPHPPNHPPPPEPPLTYIYLLTLPLCILNSCKEGYFTLVIEEGDLL